MDISTKQGEHQGTCCEAARGVEVARDLPSAVDFATTKRPHISLNVKSLRESLPFYRALFNARPTKLRDDYAKWECAEPPINLAILENPTDGKTHGHFGIEVKSTGAVNEYLDRLKRSHINVEVTEADVACCYSVQTKLWTVDPDGNHWEVFVVTEDADEGCGMTCLCYDPETGGCDWSRRKSGE